MNDAFKKLNQLVVLMTLLILDCEAIYLSLGEILIDLKIYTDHNQNAKYMYSSVLKKIFF